MALRNKDKILGRNHAIMMNNIALLDEFFKDYQDLFEWVRPKGGCIGFPKLKTSQSAYDFSEDLLKAKGVLTLPNTIYDYSKNHFRIGFGRKNMPEALHLMKEFVESHHNQWEKIS